MIKVRVFWDKESEIETAQHVTSSIYSILDGKQKHLGIRNIERLTITDESQHTCTDRGCFAINVEQAEHEKNESLLGTTQEVTYKDEWVDDGGKVADLILWLLKKDGKLVPSKQYRAEHEKNET